MSVLRAAVRRGRRFAVRTAHTSRTELDLDGTARVALLDKIDAAAATEPEAAMERLRGRTLFADPYPPGTLLHRLATLLERVEDGDAAALVELDGVVGGLDARDQLHFVRLREQFMAVRSRAIRAEDVPAPASDDAWRRVMGDAVVRFQEIGRHLQGVEAGARQPTTGGAVPVPVDTHHARDEAPTTTASPAADVPSAPLYSDKTDIDAHTDADLGQFFDFSAAAAALSEGLAGSLPGDFSLTQSHQLLIRSAPLRIVAACRALGQHCGYAPGTTVVLGGSAPGAGRSAALNYVTAWARARPDWLAVFVPDAARFAQSGRRMLRSRRHPDLFTQPDLQRDWLGELLADQSGVLDRLPLRNASNGVRTLRDLVEAAVTEDADPDLIFDVFAELRASTAVRVMVAVDRFNAWLRPSAYSDPETGRALPADRLALVRAFMDLYDAGPVGGVTVVAMTAELPAPATAALKRDGAKKEVVTVPAYSAGEVGALLAHWRRAGWLTDVPGDPATFKKYVRALSGDSPRELFRVLKCL